jgi:succinate dehydrogenase / fumarate reductase flavoprotein subunit
MEVGPTLHYFMGGVRVDPDSQMTCVPGLFAAGECAAGVHGANRLGGNSLSDLLVCGKLAGDGVVKYVETNKDEIILDENKVRKIIRSATDILNRDSGENPYLIHEKLQETMQNNVGIVRDNELLSLGISDLEKLWAEFKNVKADGASQFNPGWHQAISLRNLLITSEAVARAARLREESRGAHTRVDFEGERDEWLKVNVVIKKADDGSMSIEKVERGSPDPELERIANLSLDELEEEIKRETRQ